MLRLSKTYSVSSLCSRNLRTTAAACQRVPMSKFDLDTDVRENFARLQSNVDVVKSRLRRPLTLSEKIVYGHLDEPHTADIVRGLNIHCGAE